MPYTKVARTTLTSEVLAPGTMADDSTVGTRSWTNVNNAKVEDAIYSNCNLTTSSVSHYLKATNFGFSIPTTELISGIVVRVKCNSQAVANAVKENSIKLVTADGSFGTEDKSTEAYLPTSNSFLSYGDSTDLWQDNWSASDINDSDFGVGFSVKEPGTTSRTARVDYIEITVYTNVSTYTSVSKPVTPVSVIGTIRAGMRTGLMIPLTYATEHQVTTGEDPYTNINKPTGAVYTSVLKPT